MNDDWNLLYKYVCCHSQTAFSTLYQRHSRRVYQICRRDLGDPHLAEDASQVVFALLARKAHTLNCQGSLSGWLVKTAGFVSSNTRSRERRRLRQEWEAYRSASNAQHENPARNIDIQEAIAALPSTDARLVMLRYYEGFSLAEVANTIGTSEVAARKRMSRAIDKLRDRLREQGAVVGSVAICALLVECFGSPSASASPLVIDHLSQSFQPQVGSIFAAARPVHPRLTLRRPPSYATVAAAGLIVAAVVTRFVHTPAAAAFGSISTSSAVSRPIEAPFDGHPFSIPGRIKFADYDRGGATVAYHDSDTKNSGHAYRPNEGVDIERYAKGPGDFDVGWCKAGEWVNYTVDVAASRTYHVHFSMASDNVDGGTWHLEDENGQNLTGPVHIDDTHCWHEWSDIDAVAYLQAGRHVLRFCEDTAGYTAESMRFE